MCPKGTTNLGKSQRISSGSNPSDPRNDACLVWYVDARYLSNLHKAKSQMVMSLPLGISQYLGGPWYDLSCEIFKSFQYSPHFTSETWLGVLVEHIWSTCCVFIHRWVSTTIREDYAACINPTKPWYINEVNTKIYCVYIYISKALGDWSHASQSQTTLLTSTLTTEVNLPKACLRKWYV